MAVPKRKHSKMRRDLRRTHLKAPLQQVSLCSHCKQQKVSHRVCPHCGYYAGAEVVEQED